MCAYKFWHYIGVLNPYLYVSPSSIYLIAHSWHAHMRAYLHRLYTQARFIHCTVSVKVYMHVYVHGACVQLAADIFRLLCAIIIA